MKHVPEDLVVVGEITAPHGIRGEVRVRSLSDSPDRFLHLTGCRLLHADGRNEACRINGVKKNKGLFVLKLKGVESRTAAEELRGGLLAVPRADVRPLPPGHYYVFDVVGLKAVTEEGKVLGLVKEVINIPAHDVYVIGGSGGQDILIPAVKALVRQIDLERGLMIVKSLPGLWPDQMRTSEADKEE
jgi:16S rRNA processing protein RimM